MMAKAGAVPRFWYAEPSAKTMRKHVSVLSPIAASCAFSASLMRARAPGVGIAEVIAASVARVGLHGVRCAKEVPRHSGALKLRSLSLSEPCCCYFWTASFFVDLSSIVFVADVAILHSSFVDSYLSGSAHISTRASSHVRILALECGQWPRVHTCATASPPMAIDAAATPYAMYCNAVLRVKMV